MTTRLRNSRFSPYDPLKPSLARRILWRTQVGLATALSIGLLTSAIAFSNLLSPLQIPLADWVYRSHTPSTNVLIIGIDDRSIEELGSWPWGRALQISLIDRLRTFPPRVLAFDILLNPPAPEDAELASQWSDLGHIVLSATGIKVVTTTSRPGSFPQYDAVIRPDTLQSRNTEIAHMMLFPDSDGTVRRIPVAIESKGNRYYSLGLAAAGSYLGTPVLVDSSRNKLTLRAKTISLDDKGQMLIDFSGVPGTIQTYSFSDVIRGQVPPDTFRDKLVFVGLVGDADPALYATPLSRGAEIEPNVDIQAQIADMWLSNPPHTLEPHDSLGLIASILAMSLLAGLTMPHVRPLSAAALALIYTLAYLLYSFELIAGGILPNLLLPPLSLVLTFMTVVSFRYLTEERPRRALTLHLRRYLSIDSADRVVKNIDSGELKLVGMQRMVTVLNIELRGLSDLADNESAEAVLSVTNEQVGIVSRAITDEGGIVTKPLGDSVVAVWNALLEQSDHIDRALRTASEIRRLVHAKRKQLDDGAPLSIAMAISTGTAIIGRVKTIDQPEFTVLGNAVDNAKDICAFSGPLQILVDQNTAQNSHTDIELRELSPIRIRGRKESMAIWEVKRTDLVAMEEESGE